MFDVADLPAQSSALNTIVDRHGRLDVVVANVGHRLRKPTADVGHDDAVALLEVNFVSVFELSRQAAVVMSRAGGGSIILMSSVASQRGLAPQRRLRGQQGGAGGADPLSRRRVRAARCADQRDLHPVRSPPSSTPTWWPRRHPSGSLSGASASRTSAPAPRTTWPPTCRATSTATCWSSTGAPASRCDLGPGSAADDHCLPTGR